MACRRPSGCMSRLRRNVGYRKVTSMPCSSRSASRASGSNAAGWISSNRRPSGLPARNPPGCREVAGRDVELDLEVPEGEPVASRIAHETWRCRPVLLGKVLPDLERLHDVAVGVDHESVVHLGPFHLHRVSSRHATARAMETPGTSRDVHLPSRVTWRVRSGCRSASVRRGSGRTATIGLDQIDD